MGRKPGGITLMVVTDQEFERVVRAHYADVFHFALSLAKREAEACDLTQEAFYLLASKGRQVRDITKLKSWLLTTCYREFLRRERHETCFPKVEISLVEDGLAEVTPEAINGLDAETLMDALCEVAEVYRIPVMLFYLQGHSYKEIASLLGVPAGTVMSRLARGKEPLRVLLANGLPSKPPAHAAASDTRALPENHYD